jgi:endonuclease YncB( thermonuclease family)
VAEWSYPCKILDWYDGDTPHVDLDLGFHVHYTGRARIARINAPEMTIGGAANVDGLKARDAAIALAPVGGLYTARSRKLDEYGRPLIDLAIVKDGVSVDFGMAMIEGGFAVVYKG